MKRFQSLLIPTVFSGFQKTKMLARTEVSLHQIPLLGIQGMQEGVLH